MSGEIEAAGALATAGMAARAIEGGGGPGPHGDNCLNCEAVLDGPFCHQCGQPAHISRTLGEAVHDFMHSVLHFDTRAWRTLPMIVVRPGTLTHRYIHGQRARFISPLALFLFTVFLMFFVFSIVGAPKDMVRVDPSVTAETVVSPEAARVKLDEARKESAAADAALVAARAKAEIVEKEGKPGSGGVIAGLVVGPEIRAERAKEKVEAWEKALARTTAAAAARSTQLKDASEQLAEAKKEVAAEAPVIAPVVDAAKAVVDSANETVTEAPGAVKVDGDTTIVAPGGDGVFIGARAKKGTVITEERWQDQMSKAAKSGDLNINMGDKKLNEKVRHALENPDLALYKLQQTGYKFSFLLVPISLPFIMLLFLWRRGVTLFDHVVFSLYSLSFMSLLFLSLAVISKAGEWMIPIISTLAIIGPAVHMFFHLKGTYALGWWSALWRTFFLLIFALIAASLFFLAILYLGLAV
jgi:Protein of unknown function (DUF3667)